MLSGVSIICFAASYAVALILEISRLLFRSGVRGAVMLGFAGAGLVAHSAFLYYKAAQSTASPLSSQQEWFLIAAWALVVIYLGLVYNYPKKAFGIFILPLVLTLIAIATFFADPEPFAREPASRIWGNVHGLSILAGVVSVFAGFATGAMYLWQARRLKHKRPPIQGLSLPSLEWLQKANGRAIIVSVATLGVGVLSGMILNRINGHGGEAPLPLTDPVVLSTMLMFGWLLVAGGLVLIYKPARTGRKVAYLTLASFVFLLIALAVGLSFDTQHGSEREGQTVSRSHALRGNARLDAPRPCATVDSTSTQTAWPQSGRTCVPTQSVGTSRNAKSARRGGRA